MEVTANVLVGRALCRMRQCSNLSQEDLAREARIPRITIAHIESGRRVASLDMLERMAPCFGLGIEEVMVMIEHAADASILYRTWRTLRRRESWLSLDEAERELGLAK